MPLMDALDTKRTRRYRLGSILAGNSRRTADVIAAADLEISKGSLTAINTSTFGALDNAAFDNSVAITSTDKTLTSANNPWTSADVGKTIHVAGAGSAGGTLTTTIASYASAGEVELTDAASATVAPSASSAAGLAIWGDTYAFLADPTPAYDYLGRVINSGTLDVADETNITKVRVIKTSGGDAAYVACDGVVCSVGGKYYTVQDDDVVISLGQTTSFNVTIVMPTGTQTDGREITICKYAGDSKRFVDIEFPSSNCQNQTALTPGQSAEIFYSPFFTVTYKFNVTLNGWIRKSGTQLDELNFYEPGATHFAQANITAHAGGGAGSATLIDATKRVHHVMTVATAGDSIILPAVDDTPDGGARVYSRQGQFHFIINHGANACQVFGSTSASLATVDKINNVAGATGISIPAGSCVLFLPGYTSGGNNYWFPVGLGSDFTAPPPLGNVTPNTVSATAYHGTVVNTAIAYLVTAAVDLVLADVSGAGFTVTLPASPVQGRKVTVKHVGGVANTLTIGRNGKNIEGAAADLTTAVAGTALTLQYDATYGWALV